MRSDAVRNRELITAAAARLLAERGADVPMGSIADAAGVAVGTIYRHFPDRRALLTQVAAAAMEDLLRHAREASAASARETLRGIVEHAMTLPLAVVKSLAEGVTSDVVVARMMDDLDGLLTRLVVAAQGDGALRGDLPARDIVTLLQMVVCRPGARFGDPLTVVMLDGLEPSERGGGRGAAGTPSASSGRS